MPEIRHISRASDPILRNWRLIPFEDEPELRVFLGEVTGHPLLNEGWVITSPMQWISDDRSCARTHSRLYKLENEFPRDQRLPEKPRNILFSSLVTRSGVITIDEWHMFMDMADRLCGPLPPQKVQ